MFFFFALSFLFSEVYNLWAIKNFPQVAIFLSLSLWSLILILYVCFSFFIKKNVTTTHKDLLFPDKRMLATVFLLFSLGYILQFTIGLNNSLVTVDESQFIRIVLALAVAFCLVASGIYQDRDLYLFNLAYFIYLVLFAVGVIHAVHIHVRPVFWDILGWNTNSIWWSNTSIYGVFAQTGKNVYAWVLLYLLALFISSEKLMKKHLPVHYRVVIHTYPLAFFLIYLSESKGALIAASVFLIVKFVNLLKPGFKSIVVFIISSTTLVLITFVSSRLIGDTSIKVAETFLLRLEIWRTTVSDLNFLTIFGNGWLSSEGYLTSLSVTPENIRGQSTGVDNGYLQLLFDGGIFHLLVFVMLLASLLKSSKFLSQADPQVGSMIDLRPILILTIFANLFYSLPYSVYQITAIALTLSAGINLLSFFGRIEAGNRGNKSISVK